MEAIHPKDEEKLEEGLFKGEFYFLVNEQYSCDK